MERSVCVSMEHIMMVKTGHSVTSAIRVIIALSRSKRITFFGWFGVHLRGERERERE